MGGRRARRCAGRRATRLRWIAAGFAAALSLGVVPAVTASSDAGTVVTMMSDPGHWVGAGANHLYHPGNGRVTVSGTEAVVSVGVSGGTRGESYSLQFAAPAGHALAPGLYDKAQRYPFQDAERPGLDASGEGRGCNTVTGRFVVLDLVRDGGGAIQRLWIVYEHHCEGATPALYGEVRINVPTPDGVLTAPQQLWLPDAYPGTAGTVSPVFVVNRSGGPVGVGSAALRGVHAADFTIRSDECAGVTLAPDELCVVYVRFAPQQKGPRTAVLAIVAGGHERHVRLDAHGIPGRVTWSMQSDPGDYIGQGRTYQYDVTNARIGGGGNVRNVGFGVDGNDGNWWSAQFRPAHGDILAPGHYPNAARHAFAAASQPGMDVSGSGRGCNELSGEFTVTESRFTAGGDLEWIGIEFTQRCEHSSNALRGRIEWRLPQGDRTPPAPVEDLSAAGGGDRVDLGWRNPPDADVAAVVVRYLPGTRAPAAPSVGFVGFAGAGTAATVTGLDPARAYAFSAFAVDQAGNVSLRRSVAVRGELSESDPPYTPPGEPPPPADDSTPRDTTVRRISGTSRVETAVAASSDRFADGSARAVVLARSTDFPDALAGIPLARAVAGPLLLTEPPALHRATAAEIERVLPRGGRVVLLGGEAALHPAVAAELARRGYETVRVAGRDRYETALAAAAMLGTPRTVMIALGTDFADALAAGAAAAAHGAAILLTTPDHPHAAVQAYLDEHRPEAFAVGGPAARAFPQATAVSGATREATATAVAERFFPSGPATVGLARRDVFADALSGGAHISAAGGPMLLTPPDRLHTAPAAYVCRGTTRSVVLYGGAGALSDGVAGQARERASGSGCG